MTLITRRQAFANLMQRTKKLEDGNCSSILLIRTKLFLYLGPKHS